LIQNIFAFFLIGFKAGVKKILKKEKLQYYEHNKQFNKNDNPNLLPPGRHIPEPFDVKTCN
jgi:hypothetical protein